MAENNNPQEVMDLNASMDQLQGVLMTGDSPKGELWKAWHFLQVYSTWGLRLPHTDGTLKQTLGISDTGPYQFYPSMLQGYQQIFEASDHFQKKVFPEVVAMGNSLRRFAEAAKTGDDGTFDAINELIDAGDADSLAAVLELIEDLQSQAAKNVSDAENVGLLLADYSAKLVAAESTVKATQQKVESDANVSSTRIKELKGGKEMTGSIENFKTLMNTFQKEYDHNVIVASTSPTYAWVFPFGTIAATVVAGIYGDKAVQALKNFNKMKAQFAAAKSELEVATNAHNVQSLANEGLTKAKDLTQKAINDTNTVKNAWNSLSSNLTVVSNKVEGMTNDAEDKKLKAKALIKLYSKQAGKAWAKLWPAIQELTTDPYITIESTDKGIDDLIAAILTNLDSPATKN
ncbi:hypothetical protein AAGF08_04155 [Algoriphagus sp. SE2]|uniref:hypothetical protein n=1 Tax=Algoriphagus sp. SE2 TaxID=3141536 RepID=UPI0031CD6F91